ncbi:MAG: hypothetical protein JWQ07_2394 [Ramlibacter sp.]|nr:hypothetical protein [Ramlibacter sp.]
MKYLILLLVVLAVVWFWRGSRRADSAARGKPDTPQQQDMVQCPVCSVHLPRSDALPGPGGQLYCCAEHRLSAER